MGWPILSVMVPGYLMKEFLPQNSPALCATGTTSAPVCTASQAPPIRYLPFCRVQSACLPENNDPEILLQSLSSLFHDLFQRCFSGTAINCNRAGHGQPPAEKWNTQQLFFNTHTCGGKICCRASVSQADWCLERMMDGCLGIFSRPSTS